ncbi:MAG: sugar nucleotide-binding protein [Candidatus Hodarchaeales archaeon]|jgi:dTDP-4-dehydrorhamnose reductase
MNKILLIGGSGKLGSELLRQNSNIFAPKKHRFDIKRGKDYPKLQKWIHEHDIIINAAVSRSNQYFDMFRVNTVFPTYLAEMISRKRKDKIFIQISTDKVFSGDPERKKKPYPADFPVEPDFIVEPQFSFSKWLAENNILLVGKPSRFLIIRCPFVVKDYEGEIPNNYLSSSDYVDIQATRILDTIKNIDEHRGKLHLHLGRKKPEELTSLLPGCLIYEGMDLDFSLEIE